MLIITIIIMTIIIIIIIIILIIIITMITIIMIIIIIILISIIIIIIIITIILTSILLTILIVSLLIIQLLLLLLLLLKIIIGCASGRPDADGLGAARERRGGDHLHLHDIPVGVAVAPLTGRLGFPEARPSVVFFSQEVPLERADRRLTTTRVVCLSYGTLCENKQIRDSISKSGEGTLY